MGQSAFSMSDMKQALQSGQQAAVDPRQLQAYQDADRTAMYVGDDALSNFTKNGGTRSATDIQRDYSDEYTGTKRNWISDDGFRELTADEKFAKGSGSKFSNHFTHPNLEKAMPGMMDGINLKDFKSDDAFGSYSNYDNTINLNNSAIDQSKGNSRGGVAIHELQHAAQYNDGYNGESGYQNYLKSGNVADYTNSPMEAEAFATGQSKLMMDQFGVEPKHPL